MRHVAPEDIPPFDFSGLQIRELTPDELKSASVAEIEVPPNAKHNIARSTRSDKVYFCIEGEVLFSVDGRTVILKPRDMLFVPKGEWFSYRNVTTFAARLLLIHVPPFVLASEEFRD